jgi:hypothetical protein
MFNCEFRMFLSLPELRFYSTLPEPASISYLYFLSHGPGVTFYRSRPYMIHYDFVL